MRTLLLATTLFLTVSPAMAQTTVKLHAAGSLRAVMTDIAATFEKAAGVAIVPVYGPSGSLADRIAKGEPADVFASANMEHPEALHAAGKSGPVAMFTRNKLCALAQPTLAVTPATLLDVLLSPQVKVGTSTPKSDPSGDYAWEVFRKADAVRPGSYAALEAKALKLTGSPTSPQPPEGKFVYAWVMETHQADVFLTYCTGTASAIKAMPALKSVPLPPELAVGADYGLTVMRTSSPMAQKFADFILSPQGQAILASHGFDKPGK